MNITLKNEFATVVCQTQGAELLSYQDAKGHEYLWQKDPEYWAKTSPVLFPYIGPVPESVTIHGTDYPIPRHGFARDYEFAVSKQTDTEVSFTLKVNEETLAMYPYAFTFTVSFRLEGPVLTADYAVENNGEEEMPFLVGGHPGFFCPMNDGEAFTDYMLQFEDEDVEDVHLNYPMFDNDAILFQDLKQRTVKLIHQETKKGVQFDFPDYESVAFWTPVGKDAPFLCIEPWNGGTLEQVGCTDMMKKKYVQTLEGGKGRSYCFSFKPC